MSIKFTQLPHATVPLTGAEIVCLVQGGLSKQAPVSAISPAVINIGPERAYIAAAGNNNDVAFGAAFNALMVDTTAGAAVLTGLAAGTDGQICVVTNAGPNNLDLSPANGASLPGDQLYGPVILTLLPGQSRVMIYSPSLLKWKVV